MLLKKEITALSFQRISDYAAAVFNAHGGAAGADCP